LSEFFETSFVPYFRIAIAARPPVETMLPATSSAVVKHTGHMNPSPSGKAPLATI
jgi:hypothetical protein